MVDTSITEEEVIAVAKLARLAPSQSEIASYRAHLSAVLNHATELDELDLDGVSPTAHIHSEGSGLRPDTRTESLSLEEALASAPDPVSSGFGVPQVLEGGG